MKHSSKKLITRAIIELVVLVALLSVTRYIVYNKIDAMLIEELKGSVAQQTQSIADSLNDRFRKELRELKIRAEIFRNGEMTAEEVIDRAMIGPRTSKSKGILRRDNSAIVGESLPDEFFRNLDRTFAGEDTVDYIHGRGLLFAVPFEYQGETCIFYEFFSEVAVRHLFRTTSFGGKSTLILAKDFDNWSFISEGTYPGVALEGTTDFDSTWAELANSTLIPGKTNTFYAENNIDAFFFYCTYISEKDHLILSGYVEWDDVVVEIDYLYEMMDAIFLIMIFMSVVLVGYLWRSRQAEALERERILADSANKAKSDFLSNMSHEIRTPINAVIGMDEMIIRETKEETTLEYAHNLKNAATNLLELINDILDFSKIEAGKMEIIPVEYNLSSLLNDLVNIIEKRAESKGLYFEVETGQNIPSVLFGDEIRIRQVITNILTNAVKYTEKGGVTLSVNYIPIDNKNMYLCISITDTGIGIKEEDIEKLYTAFERIEEKRNRNIEGTGLGMNITNKLLKMMGAKLTVDSVYGQGSNFSFQIIQQILNPEPIGDFRKSYKDSISQRKKYHESFNAPDARILVVDDTVMNLTVVKGLLKQTKIQIDTAMNGPEALKMVAKNKYDIIFIDHMMPGMDGIETLNAMKNLRNSLNKDTPKISLTANAISGAKEQYISAGFQDYLTKPINFEKLEAVIMEFLPEDKVTCTEKFDDLPIKNDNTKLPAWLKNVEGLNIKSGLENCGSEEAYLDVLDVFANSISVASEEIEGYFSAENWKDYTTKVHALKSTAKVIGAEELSEKAKRQEYAGNSKYIDEIKENHSALMELYKSYSEKFKPLLKVSKADSEKPLIDENILAEAFEAMKDSAKTFDYDSMEYILQSLDEYQIPENEKERYKQIKDAVERLNWEKVNELLEECQ